MAEEKDAPVRLRWEGASDLDPPSTATGLPLLLGLALWGLIDGDHCSCQCQSESERGLPVSGPILSRWGRGERSGHGGRFGGGLPCRAHSHRPSELPPRVIGHGVGLSDRGSPGASLGSSYWRGGPGMTGWGGWGWGEVEVENGDGW
jgi:hypothetical protein